MNDPGRFVLVMAASILVVWTAACGTPDRPDRALSPPDLSPPLVTPDLPSSAQATSPSDPEVESTTTAEVPSPAHDLPSLSGQLDDCRDRSLSIDDRYGELLDPASLRSEVVATAEGGASLVVWSGDRIIGGGCVPAETLAVLADAGDALYATTPVANGVVLAVGQLDGDTTRNALHGVALGSLTRSEIGVTLAMLVERPGSSSTQLPEDGSVLNRLNSNHSNTK